MAGRAKCWGIYREASNSPGRVEDDAAIMVAVAAALKERDLDVELIEPHDVEAALKEPEPHIFAMCEAQAIVSRLKEHAEAGAIIVNTPDAIRNTYRHRMIELLAQGQIKTPVSQVISTQQRTQRPNGNVWIKRYDMHAMQPDDVMYAGSESGWYEAIERFASRGMPFVVAQQHVPGDLVKFYGVTRAASQAAWFRWFYHRDKGMLGFAFREQDLSDLAFKAAAALGLEVFGGDAIITPTGELAIIDMNAWPSFARFRAEASQVIADHLLRSFHRGLRVVS